MKKAFIFLLFSIISTLGFSQISIEYCQTKAKENYPTFRNTGILEKTSKYSISNANKNYFPQLNLSAKASYQSDATSIDLVFPIPLEMDLPKMSRDQYQAVLELSQLIWDGGAIYTKKKEIKAELETKKANLEVELYTLRDRVANIYFGILSIKEQKSQALLMEKELERNFNQVSAYMEGGLANESDLDQIRVEQLNLRQRVAEIELMEKSYIRILSLMIGEDLKSDIEFKEPNVIIGNLKDEVRRPELMAFESQVKLLELKSKMLNAQSYPHLGFFAQGGYGKPVLNMFKEDADFFAIIGLRMSWNIGSFYTKKDSKRIIESNKELINTNKEAFLLNTTLQQETQKAEIQRLEKLVLSDKEIIVLRERIKKSSEYKLENGTISTSDYIKDVNALDMANQNKILHKTQLLMSIYKYNNIINSEDEK
ncbi:MAG: TolC family protein [Bacteroidales bacterium]|nr:TolC family protein [Bacteroidales bacterium]MDD4683950.1 TolC family protein [Bacteroidales bacterium]